MLPRPTNAAGLVGESPGQGHASIRTRVTFVPGDSNSLTRATFARQLSVIVVESPPRSTRLRRFETMLQRIRASFEFMFRDRRWPRRCHHRAQPLEEPERIVGGPIRGVSGDWAPDLRRDPSLPIGTAAARSDQPLIVLPPDEVRSPDWADDGMDPAPMVGAFRHRSQ